MWHPDRARFPTKLDMQAQFGLDSVDEDEFFDSLTYIFSSVEDETTLILTYGVYRGCFIDVTMKLREHDIFSLSVGDLASLRIVAERGKRWLQASFEPEKQRSDLFISIEPYLGCRWL